MEQYLEDEEIKNSDEAWLVVDRDQWTEQQLARLHRWSQGADNYGFALSLVIPSSSTGFCSISKMGAVFVRQGSVPTASDVICQATTRTFMVESSPGRV